MAKTLMFTFVTLHFILGVLNSEGNQSSKRGGNKVQSCEHDEPAERQNADLLFNNMMDHEKIRPWRRLLMSKSEKNIDGILGQQSEILDDNVQEKSEPQQLQQFIQQRKSMAQIHQRAPNLNSLKLVQNSGSNSRSSQRQDVAVNRTEQWRLVNQRRRDRASFIHRQEAANKQGNPRGDNQHTRESLTFLRSPATVLPSGDKTLNITETVRQNNTQSRQQYSKNQKAVGQNEITKTKPSLRSLDQNRNNKSLDLYRSQRTSQGIFVTKSSMIYPFVTTKQAFDYLTSYDSMPVPAKWPIKMILPERDHKIRGDEKNMANVNENSNPFINQDSSLHAGNSRFSRSPFQIHQHFSKDGEIGDIPTKVQRVLYEEDGRENVVAPDSLDNSASESLDASNFETSEHQTISVNNEDTENVTAAVKSVLTKPDSDKSRYEKRRKRLRQQRKRYNKLKRQRKRKQKKRVKEASTTSPTTFMHRITSTAGSVHAVLTEISNKNSSHGDKEMLGRSIQRELNNTRTSKVSHVVPEQEKVYTIPLHSRREDPLTGTEDLSKTGISDQSKEYSITTSDTRDHNNQNSSFYNSEPTKQAWTKLQDNLATEAKSETNKDYSYETSKQFDMTTQIEDSSDNQMFNSLKPDFTTSPLFVSNNRQTLSNGEEIQSLFEKCTEENANNSQVHSTSGQNIKDRNSPKHVHDHTNSGPDSSRVITSPDGRWSVSQVIWDNNVRRTEDSYKSADGFSAAHDALEFFKKSVENATAKDKENAENSKITNAPKASNNWNTFSTPYISDVPLSTSTPSSARQWWDRFRQKQQVSENEGAQGNSKDKAKKNNRRRNLAAAFSKQTSDSTTLGHTEVSHSKNGNEAKTEDGPFIGYKTAYDFLSNQKGPKMSAQNEARREANELNRFMGEGMCEIFNKHYVPTRIGGKCE